MAGDSAGNLLINGATTATAVAAGDWTTLAGLARDTTRIRLGTLVTSATFRLPGPLAIPVAQVDAMSGGRSELGLGAGWFLDEHRAYGIPFPPTAERFDRLEEQLAIITGLWATPEGTTFSFKGSYYTVTDSPALASGRSPSQVTMRRTLLSRPELATQMASPVFKLPAETMPE